MEKNDYIQWIANWFLKKANCVVQNYNDNFFMDGTLNSFTTLQLVMDIESEFNLSLPDSVLTDVRFSTINGLADILCEYRGNLRAK